MFSINLSGLDRLTADLDALPEQIERAAEDGLDAVAGRGKQLKEELVSVRTGAWRDGQSITSMPGERRVGDTGAAAEPITNYPGGYAQRVSETSNPAAEKAHTILGTEAAQIFEDAFKDSLERRS